MSHNQIVLYSHHFVPTSHELFHVYHLHIYIRMFLIQFTPTDIRTYIYTYVGGYDTNIRKLFHVDFYYSSHLDLTNLHTYVCASVRMYVGGYDTNRSGSSMPSWSGTLFCFMQMLLLLKLP